MGPSGTGCHRARQDGALSHIGLSPEVDSVRLSWMVNRHRRGLGYFPRAPVETLGLGLELDGATPLDPSASVSKIGRSRLPGVSFPRVPKRGPHSRPSSHQRKTAARWYRWSPSVALRIILARQEGKGEFRRVV